MWGRIDSHCFKSVRKAISCQGGVDEVSEKRKEQETEEGERGRVKRAGSWAVGDNQG